MEAKTQIKNLSELSSLFSFSLPKKKINKRATGVIAGSLILMISAIFFTINFRTYFQALHFERMATPAGRFIVYTLLILLALQVLFLIYMAYLYLKYKPIESVSDEELPTVTIIVPAYNEGKLVYSTLQSIIQSDYPKDKMEIWAIDDGSKDDTWNWIQRAKSEFGDAITVHQQPENRGKRHALYKGFTAGTGEVYVTIDSDSIIEKHTLRNLVSPFVKDQKCGAVAGNVKVLNKNRGIIPKMLNVSFVFSFEFIRSAQSSLGFVLCTPGALSAYRRNVLHDVLHRWINQRFVGKTATIGEDRAMTNMILKEGYEVVFQKNANVLTNIPITFKNLHKMFTRWGRSNVRETLMMNSFIFKNFRSTPKTGARFIYLIQWTKILLAIPFIFLMFYFFFSHPLLYLSSALTGTFIFSTIQMLFFTKQYNFFESLWAYPYSVFYLFALFWIVPYSIVTVKNGGWLTR